jgi:mono/diheme cytochrome c family protein
MVARYARKGTSLSSLGSAFVICGLIGLGCAAIQLGATPADIARAKGQADRGATVFANECARCHGQRGEGIGSASAILGPGALPEYPRALVGSTDPAQSDPQLLQIEAQARPAGSAWRDQFRTAQDLFNFVSTRMPKGNAGKLPQPDYWAVVSFMLAVQGAKVSASGLGPTNASSIPIPAR